MSNNVLLDNSIVKWLLTLDLLKDENIMGTVQDKKFQLDNLTSSLLINGKLIGKLLEKCSTKPTENEDSSLSPLNNLQCLKSTTTASGKLYNWSILCDIFKKLNIPIDSQIKSLIVAGDIHLLNEILKELFTSFNPSGSTIYRTDSTHKSNSQSTKGLIQIRNKKAYFKYVMEKNSQNSQNSQIEKVIFFVDFAC